jgi:hypothetical protein
MPLIGVLYAKARGSALQLNKSVIFLLVVLSLAIFPGLFIIPIDWMYYQLTGSNYVDITRGMIAYFFYLPIVTVILLLVTLHRMLIKKLSLKENIIYISSFLLLIFFTIIRYWGIG